MAVIKRKLLLDVATFRVYPPVTWAHRAVYYANGVISKYIVINDHFRDYVTDSCGMVESPGTMG